VTHSYEFAFLASFVGGLIAAVIVHLLDRLVSVPTVSFTDSAVSPYPHSLRLRVASYSVFCAWGSLLIFLAVLGLVAATELRPTHLAIWTFAAFTGFVVLYLALAIPLKCPKCKERITIQWTSEPKHTERVWGMDGWASVIVRVATTGRFRCMYCGQRFILSRGDQNVA
jgi:small-conductance mechanosensitive channel